MFLISILKITNILNFMLFICFSISFGNGLFCPDLSSLMTTPNTSFGAFTDTTVYHKPLPTLTWKDKVNITSSADHTSGCQNTEKG